MGEWMGNCMQEMLRAVSFIRRRGLCSAIGRRARSDISHLERSVGTATTAVSLMPAVLVRRL